MGCPLCKGFTSEAAFHFLDLGTYLTLESLKANRGRLTDLRAANAFLFAAVFVLIYVVQTAFSLPGASLAAIERVRQVASPRVLGSFALLGLFALLPTIINAVKKRRQGSPLPDRDGERVNW